MTDSIFISTSIPYVNGAPHVGFAWELVLADVLARFHRARGRRVRFLTGTDDNSLKNVRAAESEGAPTAAFVRARGERFASLCRALGLSNDDFIRTAFDPRHAPAVERLWHACDAAGDLYRSSYRGNYCVGCEQFYGPHELVDGGCPEHDAPLERIDEENHFFRLGRHQREVDRLLTSSELRIWPDGYRAEAYGWVKAGLADFSVSRSTARARGWGIPVPGDPGQIVYVWFDALANYISALGYANGLPELDEYWANGARRIHVIGKNVTRFHCVYWPAILASAGLRAPSDVVVHGFLTVEGRKIGKSLGNGVDPFQLVERYGADRLRHYLIRHFPLGRDGDFSTAALEHASNDELADQLGNLLSRVLVLLERNTGSLIPAATFEGALGSPLAQAARRAATAARAELERCDPPGALAEVLGFVRACNLELSQTEPWKLARRARETSDPGERAALDTRVGSILADAARGLLWAGALLEPFLPDAAARIASALGAAAAPPGSPTAPSPAAGLPAVYADIPPDWSTLGRGARIHREDVLFARLARSAADAPSAG
jgi:methionyl-tRNA synthetase